MPTEASQLFSHTLWQTYQSSHPYEPLDLREVSSELTQNGYEMIPGALANFLNEDPSIPTSRRFPLNPRLFFDTVRNMWHLDPEIDAGLRNAYLEDFGRRMRNLEP